MTTPKERMTDIEIATVMGWAPTKVGEIRKHYVDDAVIVIALGERIANSRQWQKPNKV